MQQSAIEITTDFRETDRPQVERLLRAYETGLGLSLDFQGFEAEIAALPGQYCPPDGALLLARSNAHGLVGIVAVRGLDRVCGICEMKRLYVTPEGRGHGLGRRLAQAAFTAARRMRYRTMRLDTLPAMREAQALYARLGFRDIANYNANPVQGARFLEKDLRTP